MNLTHYIYWLGKLDKWCEKHHGISRKQALSILFEDSPYNPNGEDLVTRFDIMSIVKCDDFYEHFHNNLKII